MKNSKIKSTIINTIMMAFFLILELVRFRFLAKKFNEEELFCFHTLMLAFYLVTIYLNLAKCNDKLLINSFKILIGIFILMFCVIKFFVNINIDYIFLLLVIPLFIDLYFINSKANNLYILCMQFIIETIILIYFKNLNYIIIYNCIYKIIVGIYLYIFRNNKKSLNDSNNKTVLVNIIVIFLLLFGSVIFFDKNIVIALSLYISLYFFVSFFLLKLVNIVTKSNEIRSSILFLVFYILFLYLNKFISFCIAGKYNIMSSTNYLLALMFFIMCLYNLLYKYNSKNNNKTIIFSVFLGFVVVLFQKNINLVILIVILSYLIHLRKKINLNNLKKIIVYCLGSILLFIFCTSFSINNLKELILYCLLVFVLLLVFVSFCYLFAHNRYKRIKIYGFFVLIIYFVILIFDVNHIISIYNESKLPYVNILAYHHFVSKQDKELFYSDNEYVLAIEDFEEQLKWMKDNGYHSINSQMLYDWLNGEIELDNNSVLITIDDGNISTYYLALPLLEKYNFNAVAFIITSRVSEIIPEWDSQKTSFMGLDSINDVINNHPLLEFGSHSYDMHGRINNKSPKDLNVSYIKKDVTKSLEVLDTDLYCYPFGGYSDNYIIALKEAGYKMAFTFGNNKKARINDDVYKISRLTVNGSMSLDEFKKILD